MYRVEDKPTTESGARLIHRGPDFGQAGRIALDHAFEQGKPAVVIDENTGQHWTASESGGFR